MATMAENVIAAGKDNGEMLIDSIENGTYQLLPEITVKAVDGVTNIKQKQTVTELSQEEKLRYDNDIKAVNILLLGLPQERESMLYDEFDKFTYEPGESIHSYYLRYAKLINDMKMIPMSMSNMQINTKFVNHLQPEWSRFVTAAKQARDLHRLPSLQIYAPTIVQQPPTFQLDTEFAVLTFLPTDDLIASLNKAVIFLSSTYSLRYPPTNNQLRTSSNPRTQATIQNGQVIVQNVQGRQSQGYEGSTGNNQPSGARVVNTVGYAGANQPRVIKCYNCNADSLEETDDCEDLQLQATTNFKADHVDAYDLDCDDKATANAICMENLSLVGSINGDTVELCFDSNILSKVPHYETYHEFDMLNSDIQELEYIKNIVTNNEVYDDLTSNSNVISYADYMVTIGNDEDNYVHSPVQKNDRILSVIEHMKTQVEKCNMENNYIGLPRQVFRTSFLHQTQKVFPKKLPSTSQVLKNLNNARDLLNKLDECIKRRTTLSPHQIGSWEQSDIKGAFKKDVIPFSKNLKEVFKLFENRFLAEVKEMKDIFEQMEDEVEQCSVATKCFKIEKKQLLINNDRLLEENIASDIMCTYLPSLNEVDN
ncbi:hypothetical protein Tco_0977630 [Tanacetum coccineum]|uniref:Integrase, catalytic region, zinc finger, CCHC-type, peptidase aspartic, catalytic n=1 Tax=Tanacetum coccineum TaxID=301880 RepID=A0ABQ5EL29_9ASTR